MLTMIMVVVSPHWGVLDKFVRGRRWEMDGKVAGLTWTRMIMTFILCYEGDQMLQVFRCQATVEHRAQSYDITANSGKS